MPLTLFRAETAARRWLVVGGVAVVLAVALASAWWLYPVHLHDDFEADNLGFWRWSSHRFASGAVRMQQRIVRSGHGAAEITLRSGDVYEPADRTGAATERAEIQERWWYHAHLDRTYRYAFSLYIPADFPIVPTRLIIAQWKQTCAPWTECTVVNPVLAVRYQNGELFVTRQSDSARSDRTELYRTREDVRGRWLDFRFDIRFAHDDSGRIDGWLDGAPIARYRGRTAFLGGGYTAPHLFRFKTGLYRDLMKEPMTIYVDEFRKDELSP